MRFFSIYRFIISCFGRNDGRVCPMSGNGLNRKGSGRESLGSALVKAKGGRERLRRIDTLLFTFVDKKGPTLVRLHVPPTRVWDILYRLDGTPRAYRSDSSIPLQEWANPDGTGDSSKKDPANWHSLERVIYLLETRYEKPTPQRVTQQRVGKTTYDILKLPLAINASTFTSNRKRCLYHAWFVFMRTEGCGEPTYSPTTQK